MAFVRSFPAVPSRTLLVAMLLATMSAMPSCAHAALAAISSNPVIRTAGDVEADIDAVLAPQFKADEPGATVIVVRDGRTLFRKAYGAANLETKTAMQPDMVLRIGSLTKQFTAVAIFMLAERGKLAIGDDIRKTLPDFPDKGQTITIEHLLTHTSGIPNYTDNPQYVAGMARDMSVAQMIDTFKNEPLQFTPGERFAYSNSGYFLLGAIIEKAAGIAYAEFMAKQIFEPLGMHNTAYEGFERGAKRIDGYARGTSGFEIAPPLSMTQPYSAGSLISNVDDMARWDAAISAGRLLKPESWKRVFTPYTFNNGEKSTYATGWRVRSFRGREAIDHSGGINGFLTFAMRLPQDKTYVAVMINAIGRDASPTHIAERVAAIAIGRPYPNLKPVKLDAKLLDRYEGVYKIDDKSTRIISRVGDSLVLQRGGTRVNMQPYSENEFFLPNFSYTRYKFVTNEQGKVTAMLVYADDDGEETNPRIGDKPAERPTAAVTPAAFDALVGQYQLAANFIMTVSRDGARFFTQATGQAAIEIFAESATRYFPKVIDATLQFNKDADGKVTELVLTQNGRDMRAKKIK